MVEERHEEGCVKMEEERDYWVPHIFCESRESQNGINMAYGNLHW